MSPYYIIIFSFISTISFGQKFKGRDTLGVNFAKDFISRYPSINDSTRFHYKSPRYKNICLLSDTATALQVAMPILTKAFGKEELEKWRPFEIYFISNYWFIRGTSKTQQLFKELNKTGGDPFIMVIDAYNSRVMYMMAGE